MRGIPQQIPWSSTGKNPMYRFFDEFDGNVLSPPWSLTSGTVTFQDAARGVILLAADAGAATQIDFVRTIFYRAASPVFELNCYTTTIAKGCEMTFNDNAGGHRTWGITFDPAASANWRLTCKNGGGAIVHTVSTTPVVASTWYKLRCWLSGAVGAQTANLTINGVDLTQYSAVQPDPDLSAFHLWQDNGAAGGTGLFVDWLGIEADFSKTPA